MSLVIYFLFVASNFSPVRSFPWGSGEGRDGVDVGMSNKQNKVGRRI